MSDQDQENFEKGEAGASHTYPQTAGTVKKGGYCMLKGFPCRVIDISTSKAGKHGHAKATVVGKDIFTNKQCEDAFPSSHNVEVPFVKKTEYQLLDIGADGFVSLLKDNGETKEDLKLPADEPELCAKIKEDFEGQKDIMISVLEAMGQEKIIAHRENSK